MTHINSCDVDSSSDFRIGAHVIAHERLVMTRTVGVVVELPAVTTEVAETAKITAEVGTRLAVAAVTHGVLQVRVDLHLWS